MLYEEAARVSLFGLEMYTYGLYAALGAAAAALMYAWLCRQSGLKKGTASLTLALALPLAFALSRLLFCLLDASARDMLSLRLLLKFSGGGHSMYGALAGAALGAFLAARITGQKALALMDLLAPALLMFIAVERLGESVLELPFGVSRPLTDEAMQGSVLAVRGEYESYLRTYLLESFAAFVLVVAVQICRRNYRRAGSALTLAALLYGAAQTIFESLRFDAHMRVSFVGMQQVASMALLLITLLALAVRMRRDNKRLSLAAFVAAPLSLALGILIEFMIDRSGLNRFALYAAFTLVVAVPAYLGVRLLDGRDALG